MRAGVWSLLAVAFLGCGTHALGGAGDKPLDLPALRDALRTAGATVQSGGAVEQPFFTVRGRFIRVNGGDVQVFQYRDEPAARREAALVSPEGGRVGGSAMMWAAAPHFYRKGRLIALYVGDDPSVKSVLQAVLGPQFAGQ